MKSFLKQEMNPMPSSLDNKKKHVRFGLLTIDEYPTVLGHSVIPRSGPPITIGQKPFRRTVMGLDRFENAVRSDRRRKFELLLDENVYRVSGGETVYHTNNSNKGTQRQKITMNVRLYSSIFYIYF